MGSGSSLPSAGLAVLLVSAAFAGDPPQPAAPEFLPCLDRAHALVTGEKWAEGEAALRKLFTDFTGDARVRSHLREIEDDLKLCVFRRAQGPLKGSDLFGAAAVRFTPSTRDVELSFADTRGRFWTTTEDRLQYLNLQFEGQLTVDADVRYIDAERRTTAVLLCYDVEKRGGYLVLPGFYRDDGTTILSAPAGIKKLTSGNSVELTNKASGSTSADYGQNLTVQRVNGDIVAKVGTVTVARASDTTYSSGYIGFTGGSASSMTIKGRLDKHAFRKLLGEHYSARYAEWQSKSWKRGVEIPAWAVQTDVAVPDSTLFDVPSDTPESDRDEVAGAATSAAEGKLDGIVLAAARAAGAPKLTSLYLRAAMQLGTGGFKAASDHLDELCAGDPKLVPARLLRGRARFGLRRLDDARADLEWVVKERPSCGEAYAALANLEIFRNDLAAASAVLERATERGAAGEDLAEALDWVHRARRGPQLAQRFEHVTDHFVVVSDHSKKVCFDTGTLLEKMQAQYAAALGPAQHNAVKSRVYVFSGREGYTDYAEDLDVPSDSTAGVYLRMLRELVMWIPDDMTDFAHTTRHEGFHQYLHRLVERAPIWFNEGWAEVMGGGGPEGIRNAARDGEFVKVFLPVKQLVAMRQPSFMAKAGVCYTQSRYLVDFLRTTKNPKLKTLLADYFAAISSGLSQDEANKKVLEPVMDELELAFRGSLK